jgi:hypothetical protein
LSRQNGARTYRYVKYIPLKSDLRTNAISICLSPAEKNCFLWEGHVARIGDKRNAYMILVGKPEGKRALARPRHRWVDNIWMDLEK